MFIVYTKRVSPLHLNIYFNLYTNNLLYTYFFGLQLHTAQNTIKTQVHISIFCGAHLRFRSAQKAQWCTSERRPVQPKTRSWLHCSESTRPKTFFNCSMFQRAAEKIFGIFFNRAKQANIKCVKYLSLVFFHHTLSLYSTLSFSLSLSLFFSFSFHLSLSPWGSAFVRALRRKPIAIRHNNK